MGLLKRRLGELGGFVVGTVALAAMSDPGQELMVAVAAHQWGFVALAAAAYLSGQRAGKSGQAG